MFQLRTLTETLVTVINALYQEFNLRMDIMFCNRFYSLCSLAIWFLLFILIVTLVYLNPDSNASCDYKKVPEDTVPQLQYCKSSLPLAPVKVVEVVAIDRYESYSSNFLPDVNDIELLDEATSLGVPLYEAQVDPVELPDARDREALTAVKMALKLTKLNNIEKAKRLFQHAMVLSPNQHDVLLYYGEFLESNNDFINADHYYLKALMIQPDSPRALFNRRRTLPIVTQLDLEELKRIDMKNECLIKMIKNKDPSLKRLKKEIYFQHIHHSVAIEGNTMSLAETRTIVETRLAVSGKSVVEHNEILGLEAALRFVNQTLVARNSFITVSDILEIHRRVMGHTDPVTAGTFRQSQVFVGAHRPPPASEVEYLMEQFVGMLRGPEITAMHPINIAAFAHHKLVNIHPFLDGNGRTARLLMNLLFMKYGYPPIIIRKEDRSQYYKYLQIANEGDPRPFYRFIAHAAECTLDAFLCSAGQCAQKRIKGSETKSRITDVIPIGQ